MRLNKPTSSSSNARQRGKNRELPDFARLQPPRVFVADEGSSNARENVAARESSLSTLAIGLGHDICNVVLPILCHLDSLDSQPLPESARLDLQAVRESIMHLRRLSNSLTLLTDGANEESEDECTTSVVEWWRNMEPMLRKSLPANVRLDADFPADLPPVKLPPRHLTQAMFNLVINAGEAMISNGHIRIWARQMPDEGRVEIGVTDNGAGMSQEVSQHARDPFFTTKTRRLSTGLGLSQVDAIVVAARGLLRIESAPRQGTTVLMELPACEPLKDRSGDRPRARVSLHDGRIASYARALLVYSGFEVDHEGDDEAEDDLLLITDTEEDSFKPAKDFVNDRPERRVIAVGEPSNHWNVPEFVVVDGSHHAMARELRRVAQEAG